LEGGPGVDGRGNRVGFEEADAAVPAEDAVVIADGADFFGFAEIVEGFFDEREKDVGGTAGAEAGLWARRSRKRPVV